MNSIKINGKDKNLKKFLLSLFNSGIRVVKPKIILNKYLKIQKSVLLVNTNQNKYIKYKNIDKIYILCIGKASVETAETINKIFKKSDLKIFEGILVSNKENFRQVKNFKCFSSGHPLPNTNGVRASKYIVKSLKNTTENDLILILISGGGSSLLPLPADDINLKDKITINKKLIECGAIIDEINAVRKHLSKIKGGNLLKYCFPSKVHSLILSDVVGDDLSSISSGLTVPDHTTFDDAKRILEKYDIWRHSPKSIIKYIKDGILKKKPETPNKTNRIFKNSKNTLMGSNAKCLNEIKKECNKLNINCIIWKRDIEGDVKKVAQYFVKSIGSLKKKKPVILISGGESTVKIRGTGVGGRNQELALHFINYVKKDFSNLKYTFLSAGTDGRDGPTNAAGAIVDQTSLNEIKKKKINFDKELKNNNSYNILKQIKSLVIIKGTNTNVADIQLLALLDK
ncbi:MAG: glycerate kinase [Rickettsiales bacterium]|nr:glycerate kinase [Rickettsiales bacterium]